MGDQTKTAYQEKPSTINFFANAIENEDDHNFYGTLVTAEGEVRKLQLYTKTSKEKKVFLIGNVADNNKMLNDMSNKIEKDQLNSLVLFLNDRYVELSEEKVNEGEKTLPYYTGFYINQFGVKFQLSLWKKVSLKSSVEYFSGKVTDQTVAN